MDVVVVDSTAPAITLDSSVCPHRVIMLWHPPIGGIAGALNAGLQYILANDYQYVARIDAGDFALPRRFERQVQFLDENPTYGLVGSLCSDLEGNSLGYQDIPSSRLKRKLHIKSCFAHPAVMLTTNAIRKTGFYNGAIEDWDYWLRLSKHFESRNLPEVLTKLDTGLGSLCRDTVFSRRIIMRTKKLVLALRHFECRYWESYAGILLAFWVLLVNLVIPPSIIIHRKKF